MSYDAKKLRNILFVPERCEAEQFQCEDGGGCAEAAWLCDGDADCSDGSDEADCPAGSQCGLNMMKCSGSAQLCIPRDQLCDGNKDCPDGSDETDCPHLSCDLTTHFLCADSSCVPLANLCDGVSHCEDSEDEADCDVNECEENNGGGQQICVNTPRSWRCECSTGYQLVTNNTCAGTAAFTPQDVTLRVLSRH